MRKELVHGPDGHLDWQWQCQDNEFSLVGHDWKTKGSPLLGMNGRADESSGKTRVDPLFDNDSACGCWAWTKLDDCRSCSIDKAEPWGESSDIGPSLVVELERDLIG